MISLEEYKKHLIEYYVYEIDNNDEAREKRRTMLDTIYGDEYLQKIINNTYDFIKTIFEKNTLEHGYCNFEVENNKTTFIHLDLKGGWYSDYLYYDNKRKIISEYILKQEFGRFFDIHIESDLEPFATEDKDLVSYTPHYSLYMQGFPKNIEETKERLFGNSKQLIRTI